MKVGTPATNLAARRYTVRAMNGSAKRQVSLDRNRLPVWPQDGAVVLSEPVEAGSGGGAVSGGAAPSSRALPPVWPRSAGLLADLVPEVRRPPGNRVLAAVENAELYGSIEDVQHDDDTRTPGARRIASAVGGTVPAESARLCDQAGLSGQAVAPPGGTRSIATFNLRRFTFGTFLPCPPRA
jgi:hypothetical protein